MLTPRSPCGPAGVPADPTVRRQQAPGGPPRHAQAVGPGAARAAGLPGQAARGPEEAAGREGGEGGGGRRPGLRGPGSPTCGGYARHACLMSPCTAACASLVEMVEWVEWTHGTAEYWLAYSVGTGLPFPPRLNCDLGSLGCPVKATSESTWIIF